MHICWPFPETHWTTSCCLKLNKLQVWQSSLATPCKTWTCQQMVKRNATLKQVTIPKCESSVWWSLVLMVEIVHVELLSRSTLIQCLPMWILRTRSLAWIARSMIPKAFTCGHARKCSCLEIPIMLKQAITAPQYSCHQQDLIQSLLSKNVFLCLNLNFLMPSKQWKEIYTSNGRRILFPNWITCTRTCIITDPTCF